MSLGGPWKHYICAIRRGLFPKPVRPYRLGHATRYGSAECCSAACLGLECARERQERNCKAVTESFLFHSAAAFFVPMNRTSRRCIWKKKAQYKHPSHLGLSHELPLGLVDNTNTTSRKCNRKPARKWPGVALQNKPFHDKGNSHATYRLHLNHSPCPKKRARGLNNLSLLAGTCFEEFRNIYVESIHRAKHYQRMALRAVNVHGTFLSCYSSQDMPAFSGHCSSFSC